MSTQVEPRVEVGKCDLGYVFIYHKASKGDYTDKFVDETWQVRAGNHTVGTYGSEAEANAVARALVGEQQLTNEFAAEVPAAMEEYVADTRKRVSKR